MNQEILESIANYVMSLTKPESNNQPNRFIGVSCEDELVDKLNKSHIDLDCL